MRMRRPLLSVFMLSGSLAASCQQGNADGPPPPSVDLAGPPTPADLAAEPPPDAGAPVDAAADAADPGWPADPPQVVFAGLGPGVRATAVALNRAGQAELVLSTDTSIEALRETPSGWIRSSVQAGIRPQRGVHIVLKDDVPWISYQDLSGTAYVVKVAHAEAASWVIEEPTSPGVGSSEAGAPLAIDGSGAPIVAFRSGRYGLLSQRGSGGWTGIGIFLNEGSPLSLRLGSNGLLQLAYLQYSTLTVAQQTTSGGWINLTAQGMDGTLSADLAIDALDTPHLGMFDSKTGQVRYAHNPRRAASWPTDVLDTTSGGPVALGLARSPRGEPTPIVAYQRRPDADLKVARRSAGRWQVEAVDTAGDVGHALSLAVDTRGRAHIFYVDVSNQTLKRVIR